MSVISPANTVIATTTVGGVPQGGVAVSPAGPEAGDVYVSATQPDMFSVIDPTTNMVIATITVGSGPDGVAVSPTGPEAGYVYVTNRGDGTVSVIS